jgi:DNA-binding NtrC family response regulator
MSENLILIVDDDPGVREVLGSFLEEEGYAIITAEGGEEALKLIHEKRPSLLFLDIFMPGVSGLDVIRQIRTIDRSVPVVMITGYDSDDIARELLLSGATDFIRKPIKLEYVKRVVISCLAKSSRSIK